MTNDLGQRRVEPVATVLAPFSDAGDGYPIKN